MSSTKNIRVIAYCAIGVLVFILIGVLAYLYYPNVNKSADTSQIRHIKVGGVSSVEANNPFNVNVLSEKAYKNLSRVLLDANKIPVKVPENRGKVNLFEI